MNLLADQRRVSATGRWGRQGHPRAQHRRWQSQRTCGWKRRSNRPPSCSGCNVTAPRGLCHSGLLYDNRRDEGKRYYEYRKVPAHLSPQSVFGVRLRLARKAAGIPQDKLGVLAGLDEASASARISRYESGVHEPNIAFAERLAAALNVPAAYFYAADDELARLILWFGQLDATKRRRLLEFASSAAD